MNASPENAPAPYRCHGCGEDAMPGHRCGDVRPAARPPILAEKGRAIGWWDGRRFQAATPGRAFQLRSARFCQARRDLAGVVILDSRWSLVRP